MRWLEQLGSEGRPLCWTFLVGFYVTCNHLICHCWCSDASLGNVFCSSWEILREIPHSFPYRSPITRYWVRDCCLMSHPLGFWATHIESDKRAMLTTGQNTSSSPSHPELLWKLEIPVDPAALTLPLPSSSSHRRVILRNSREQRPINICLLLKLIWVQTLQIWHRGRKDCDLL